MPPVIDLPTGMNLSLREVVPDLEPDVREAVGLDLFRKEKITLYELGQILGKDRFETDAYLQARGEYAQIMSVEDVYQDVARMEAYFRDHQS